jgi:hypothetical protein
MRRIDCFGIISDVVPCDVQTAETLRRLCGNGEKMAVESERKSRLIGRRGALFVAGAAAFVGFAGKAIATNEVGHVASVAGNGYAGDAPLRRLRAEEGLRIGDRVWTEAGSRASLIFDLGAVVHMGPKAQLILDRFVAESSGVLTLEGGGIVFDRDDGLPKLDFQVRSAFAQIGLRGTRFFAGPNRGVFAIFVERGSVSVSVSVGAGDGQVVLNAGDGVDITAPGARPSEVKRWPQPRIAEAFESVLA